MTIIIGHKGACGYAAENTLDSFEVAIAVGCSRAELDVRLTADGEAAVIHDSTVDRATDGTGSVRSFTLERLQRLRCKDGQSIPSLRQVVDLCKNKIDLQIELKESGTPRPVYKIIVENKIESHVVVSSFYPELLAEMKNFDASIRTLLLLRGKPDDLRSIADDLELYAVGLKADDVTADLIKDAHDRKMKVYAYRVNTKDAGDRLSNMGVDELGTDYPKLFLS